MSKILPCIHRPRLLRRFDESETCFVVPDLVALLQHEDHAPVWLVWVGQPLDFHRFILRFFRRVAVVFVFNGPIKSGSQALLRFRLPKQQVVDVGVLLEFPDIHIPVYLQILAVFLVCWVLEHLMKLVKRPFLVPESSSPWCWVSLWAMDHVALNV